ncbi:MAG TPA: hypothetical protein VMD59_03355, partial [Acidimicrobiales bacterium]|nr:hypothetical protein [Acidimicrobiales bacterium]
LNWWPSSLHRRHRLLERAAAGGRELWDELLGEGALLGEGGEPALAALAGLEAGALALAGAPPGGLEVADVLEDLADEPA